MPAPKPPTWVFNTNDIKGLVSAFGNDQIIPPERFIEFGQKEKFVRVVRSTGNEDAPHEDLDLTGATLTIAVGPRDNFPSTGNSEATFGANSVPIPAGASAATVSGLLNGLASIIAAGGVTVALKRAAYQITFDDVGARALFDWTPETLTPPSRVNVRRLVVGDGATQEVQLVEIKQDYWAGNSDWDTEPTGTITKTVITNGAAGVRELTKIEITGDPIGGKFRVSSPQPAVHVITAIQNSAALKASYSFTFAGHTIVPGDYVDLYDDAGPVRLWFDDTIVAAPAIPSGGRLLAVNATSLVAGDLGAALWAAVAADSGLEQSATSFGYPTVVIRTKVPGVYTVPLTPGFVTFAFNNGSGGRLDGKYLVVNNIYGNVGIWFNLSAGTEMPEAVQAMPQSVEVTGIAGNATAATVATAIGAALTANPATLLTPVVAGNQVTVTETLGGPRSLPSNGTSQIGVVQTKAGFIISAVLNVTATAAQMRTALQNFFDVTRSDKPGMIEFLLVASAPGDIADLTVTNHSLVFPLIYKGKLSFNTVTMFSAFADAGDTVNELTGVLEAQYQFPGEDPVKFYQENVTVNRALIDTTALSPVNILGTNYVEGSVAIANGADYVDVVFPGGVEFPSEDFTVMSCSIENSVDSPPPDNLICGVISDKVTTGFRQYFSGPTSNGNCVYKYVAKH